MSNKIIVKANIRKIQEFWLEHRVFFKTKATLNNNLKTMTMTEAEVIKNEFVNNNTDFKLWIEKFNELKKENLEIIELAKLQENCFKNKTRAVYYSKICLKLEKLQVKSDYQKFFKKEKNNILVFNNAVSTMDNLIKTYAKFKYNEKEPLYIFLFPYFKFIFEENKNLATCANVSDIEPIKKRFDNYNNFVDYLYFLFENKELLKINFANQDVKKEIEKHRNNLHKITYFNFMETDTKVLDFRITFAKKIKHEFNEINAKVRDDLKDLNILIKAHSFFESMFDQDLDVYLKIHKKIQLDKKNQPIEETTSQLIDLSTSIDKLIAQQDELIKPLMKVLNEFDVNDRYYNDYRNYYLYLLGKLIQKKSNLYGKNHNIDLNIVNELISIAEDKLYVLTKDQKNAIKRSFELINSNGNTNCLIQGDVGCGKTIVSVIIMFTLALAKKKCVYIIPRINLRIQHYNTLQKYNKIFNLNLKIAFAGDCKDLTDVDIVLNGYSFNEEKFSKVEFDLAYVDEIQLFGVDQRNQIQKKYKDIDMFYTTATPHPRTKLLSLIGNMEIIEIRQLPEFRKPKITRIFQDWNDEIQKLIEEQIAMNYMVIVVSPVVNKSTNSHENVHEALEIYQKRFPDAKCVKLLSNYSVDRKYEILEQCKNGEIDILVATKSIEVGMDLTNANVIVIHYPYNNKVKWGMAQLHQLRGRVGRSSNQGYCYIEYPGIPPTNSQTWSVLQSQDVFELTQSDIDWRGFEKIIGFKQSGSSLSISNAQEIEKRINIYKQIVEKTKVYINELSSESELEILNAVQNQKILDLN